MSGSNDAGVVSRKSDERVKAERIYETWFSVTRRYAAATIGLPKSKKGLGKNAKALPAWPDWTRLYQTGPRLTVTASHSDRSRVHSTPRR